MWWFILAFCLVGGLGLWFGLTVFLSQVETTVTRWVALLSNCGIAILCIYFSLMVYSIGTKIWL